MPRDSTDQALDAAAAHAAAGRPAVAERVLLEALARDPFHADALHHLAVLVGQAGRVDRAVELLRRSTAANPTVPEAQYHLGVALTNKGQLSAAAEAFARSAALRPDFAEPRVNLAMLRLTHGDYAGALPEYEWRTRVAHFVHPPPLPVPLWDGSPLAGRTLLLRAEQGFGDTIHFARYAPLIRDRFGGRVVLEVQRPLLRLLTGFPGTDAVVAVGDPVPSVDAQLPLLSAMLRTGTTAATMPGPTAPPLPVDRALAAAWAQRVGPRTGGRIGIAWAGSPTNTNDRNRSVPLSTLAPLGRVPGVRLFNLQLGVPAPLPPEIVDLTGEVRDFADTAALVEQLDAVVTVDTAVAHLAGSMGKPTFVMVPFVPDWRWGLGRPDTPWYPSLRLVRQPAVGRWDAVVAAVATALGPA